jgi:hypothetical protein
VAVSRCLNACITGFCALALVILVSCEREQRQFRGASGLASSGSSEANASAVAAGKHLYERFNCVGCHGHGGGGIGPPLLDGEWIHGSEPATIFTVIVEGSPNGMPSFRGKIPEAQVWQLVAYVRSLSGLVPHDAAPGRSDHMQSKISVPPRKTPRVQTFLEQRTAEEAVLNSYAWVNYPAGIARIPIDRAIELLVERGLPVSTQPPTSTRMPKASELSQ